MNADKFHLLEEDLSDLERAVTSTSSAQNAI